VKKTLFVLFFLSITVNVLAQDKVFVTIHRDTINVRGYIFESNGHAASATISSLAHDVNRGLSALSTKTDTSGYFELKGAYFNDTLIIQSSYAGRTVINTGSRFLKIKLPPKETLPASGNVQITAVRKHKHIIPTFKFESPAYGCLLSLENYAAFPGGIERFKNFIKSHITYPPQAIEHNIEGDVEVAFTIARDGSLINPTIVRGLGYGCDEAVLAIVKQSPRWQPGLRNGYPIIYDSSVTINFKLTDKK
jgi:TonB family protein